MFANLSFGRPSRLARGCSAVALAAAALLPSVSAQAAGMSEGTSFAILVDGASFPVVLSNSAAELTLPGSNGSTVSFDFNSSGGLSIIINTIPGGQISGLGFGVGYQLPLGQGLTWQYMVAVGESGAISTPPPPMGSWFISIDPGTQTSVAAQVSQFTLLANSQGAFNFEYAVAAVPEPQTYALMLAGMALVGGVARRQRRRAALNAAAPASA